MPQINIRNSSDRHCDGILMEVIDMTNEEATIEALQGRVRYLEAHLHLALQVLQQIEQDNYSLTSSIAEEKFERSPQNQTIEIMPTSKIELPTFLNSRTWKHFQGDMAQVRTSGDRDMRHLKVS